VEAGADIIAPSNMMDGFVVEIRRGLDEAGYYNISAPASTCEIAVLTSSGNDLSLSTSCVWSSITPQIHDGVIQQATRIAKKMYDDLLIVADTCLCEYTDCVSLVE
jgi:delta-aminolevulinic acid dehydratase/porphobilinogen synthase